MMWTHIFWNSVIWTQLLIRLISSLPSLPPHLLHMMSLACERIFIFIHVFYINIGSLRIWCTMSTMAGISQMMSEESINVGLFDCSCWVDISVVCAGTITHDDTNMKILHADTVIDRTRFEENLKQFLCVCHLQKQHALLHTTFFRIGICRRICHRSISHTLNFYDMETRHANQIYSWTDVTVKLSRFHTEWNELNTKSEAMSFDK